MGHRILVVEDDHHCASQLKELFEFHGHVVVLATTGPDGIAKYEESRPALVLLDLMLPQVHGLRVLEAIRGLPGGADVPALLMSAVYRNESLFAQDIKRLGVLSFLSKPFSIIDLGRKVNNILAEPEMGRASVRAIIGSGSTHSSARLAAVPVETLGRSALPSPAAPTFGDRRTEPAFDDRRTEPALSAAPDPVGVVAARTGPPPPPTPPRPEGIDRQRYVHLLTHLFHAHTSGRLELSSGGGLTLYLLNGYPVWAETGRPADLVDWLVAEGVLDDADAAPLRRHSRAPELRAALLGSGLLNAEAMPALLEAWVAWQVRRGLSAEGAYEFEAGDDFAGMIPVYEVNPLRELVEALGDVDAAELLAELESATLGRPLGRTRTFNRLFGYVASTAAVRELGERFLRPRTVAEIRFRLTAADDDVIRALWLLFSAGLLALADAADAAPVPPGRREVAAAPKRPEQETGEAPSVQRVPPGGESPGADERDTGDGTPRFETRRYGKGMVDALRERSDAVSDDETEARIARDYVTRMELDHYDFLGVARSADAPAIEAAYRTLAPAYRPRNLGKEAHPDMRRQSKELLAKLVQALDDLSDPARRARYDATLERADRMGRAPPGAVTTTRGSRLGEEAAAASASASPADQDATSTDPLLGYPSADADLRLTKRVERLGRTATAEWRAARTDMRAGEHRRAFSRLEALRGELPSEPALLADMAWCRFNLGRVQDERDLEKALEWVELATAFEPSHPDVLDVQARILIHGSDRAATMRALQRLLRTRPSLAWAKRELEQGASEDEKAGKGLFGGIFGRRGGSK